MLLHQSCRPFSALIAAAAGRETKERRLAMPTAPGNEKGRRLSGFFMKIGHSPTCPPQIEGIR